MNLFEVKNNIVAFSPQALVLKPFREIWDNDRSKDKEQAVKELSYVYYMSDDRSDYMYILDMDERSTEVIRVLDLEDNWIIPKYVNDAIEYYIELSETVSTRLLHSTRKTVAKISLFLDNIDLDERDQRTRKPIHDINRVVGSVEKIPKLVKALNEIEKEVIKEKELRAQSGNRNVGTFDDEGI